MTVTAIKDTKISLEVCQGVRTENEKLQAEKELRFPPLAKIVTDTLFADTKEKYRTIPTGLPNLDVALNGGFSPGLHMLAGEISCGKQSLLTFLMEEFIKQKYAVILMSSHATPQTLLQTIISRHTFKENPQNAIPLDFIPTKLSTDPFLSKRLIKDVFPIIKSISLVETKQLDIYSLRERFRNQKERHAKSIFLLDIHEFSVWNEDPAIMKVKLEVIRQIANELQVAVILTYDLNQSDAQNLKHGHATITGIERYVDTFLFLNAPSPRLADEATSEQAYNSFDNILLTLQIQKNSIEQKRTVYLTHRVDFGYFQEG